MTARTKHILPIRPKAEAIRPTRIARRHVSGILLLDKPSGISSNHALQAVKRLYRAEKAGHAGTLDPLASGLLPVLLGDATRFSGYLLEAEKAYEAEVRLGATTTTGDAEGEVLESRPVTVGRAEVEAVLARFRGIQSQVPPMYSALKRDGRPLYELARRGETVERAPRTIEVFTLELAVWAPETLNLEVRCSKGTYIRTLAEDIGAALGCGAHLSALRRSGTGAFRISEATSLDVLSALDEAGRDKVLRPVDQILIQLPKVELDPATAARFGHGQAVQGGGTSEGLCRVYAASGRFLGLAEASPDGRLAPRRLIAERAAESPTG